MVPPPHKSPETVSRSRGRENTMSQSVHFHGQQRDSRVLSSPNPPKLTGRVTSLTDFSADNRRLEVPSLDKSAPKHDLCLLDRFQCQRDPVGSGLTSGSTSMLPATASFMAPLTCNSLPPRESQVVHDGNLKSHLRGVAHATLR